MHTFLSFPLTVVVTILFHVISISAAGPLNSSGRSYYFKTNGNNEFKVYNRIQYLNHNISDYDANPHPPLSIKVVKKGSNHLENGGLHKSRTINLTRFYLDDEWNYHHKPINRSSLPVFIKQFYEQRLKQPNNTDTMRFFFNENRNKSSRIIKFQLNTLHADENVTDADLYFYWPLDNSSSVYKTSVVLRLYQFERQKNNDLNETNLVENPDIHKLFNVIYISKAQKGWQTFKIKKSIDNWVNGDENLGLLLTISSFEDNKLIHIYNDSNEEVFRTFAVLTIRKTALFSGRSSLNTIQQDTTDHKKSLTISPACSRRSWHLSFDRIHWSNFIIYPESGLSAFQCSGKCHFDDENVHMNNHIKLRQLLNGFSGFKERICCVPTEFYSFPFMYMNKFDNVVLKSYDEVIVKSCGCR